MECLDPVLKLHSSGYQPIMATPSAPFPNARITMSTDILPVQVTLTGLTNVGYCPRIVPAISPAP
jgi:hypothetical protein